MDLQVLALLVCACAVVGEASLRPRTPDELHDLLVWVAKVAEGGAAPNELPPPPAKLRARLQKPSRVLLPPLPPPRDHRPSTTTTEAPSTSTTSPALVETLLGEAPAHPLPAFEEYDRNERYAHSIVHGYRLGA